MGESDSREGGGTIEQERREVHVTGGKVKGRKVVLYVEREVINRDDDRKKTGRKERSTIK